MPETQLLLDRGGFAGPLLGFFLWLAALVPLQDDMEEYIRIQG